MLAISRRDDDPNCSSILPDFTQSPSPPHPSSSFSSEAFFEGIEDENEGRWTNKAYPRPLAVNYLILNAMESCLSAWLTWAKALPLKPLLA